jgi:hypothetical protein
VASVITPGISRGRGSRRDQSGRGTELKPLFRSKRADQ